MLYFLKTCHEKKKIPRVCKTYIGQSWDLKPFSKDQAKYLLSEFVQSKNVNFEVFFLKIRLRLL